MDPQIILIGVAVFVLSALLIYMISVFGIKEKSFEEAIAEQKRRMEEEREKARNDKKAEREKKKYKRSKEKPKEKALQVSEPEIKEPKMVNLEIDPEIIEPLESATTEAKKPVKKVKPAKPILTNKDEKPRVSAKTQEVVHHVALPKDEVELKHEHDDIIKEKGQPSSKPQKKPEKNKEEKKMAIIEDQIIVEKQTVLHTSASSAMDDKKGQRTTVAMNANQLLSAVQSASLNDSEVQNLIDTLLNKQGGASSAWNKKTQKGDAVTILRKQLEEKERTLQEEQKLAMQANANLAKERASYGNLEKQYQEKIAVQDQEIQGLRSRMQQSVEQNMIERSNMQSRIKQLKRQAGDQSILQKLSEENRMLKENLERTKSETVSQKEYSGLTRQLQIFQDEPSKNVVKVDASENLKKALKEKLAKQKDELKKLRGGEDLDEALLHASECGQKEIVCELINAGADVNCKKPSHMFSRYCYGLPEHFHLSAISLASKNGHSEVVNMLLDAGAKQDLDEVLLQASECGQKELVCKLINAGADVNFKQKPTCMFPKFLHGQCYMGKSAILLASKNGHCEVVSMLLAAGAKQGLDEALLHAIKCGQNEIVCELINAEADVNFKSCSPEEKLNAVSAISLASENGHYEVADVVFGAGAKKSPEEAFSEAFKSGQKEIVDSIISAVVRINFIRGLNMKLLSACKNGEERLVKVLLSAGANVNYTADGISPIMTALKNGHKSIIKILLLARAKVDPSILFREMLDVIVYRHVYKKKLLDKLLQVDAKISGADVISLPRLLEDLADYVLKTKIVEENVFCFLLILLALFLLQTTVVKLEMRKFTKLTFKMTGSDKIFLLCCHDVEQHPGPLSTAMNDAYRRLISILFLSYWGVKDKKEFTRLARESPDKQLNAKQQYADENKPRNWNDQYCFDDPSNPRKRISYMPHEKCSMLLGMVESCYTENKIPEECVLQELEAFTNKDDARLKALVAKKQLIKTIQESMSILNEHDLKNAFNTCGLMVQRDTSRQNATGDVSMETDNYTDNACRNGEANTSHTKTGKERLQDLIAKLKVLSKNLEEESKTTHRPGRKRKAPSAKTDNEEQLGEQIDNEVLEEILEELAVESAKKSKSDYGGSSTSGGSAV